MRCCRAENLSLFLLTPLREGRPEEAAHEATQVYNISTHAPAGGATHRRNYRLLNSEVHFYSRPCGRGDIGVFQTLLFANHFYSRPCGRGDRCGRCSRCQSSGFLLTPLREGRPGKVIGQAGHHFHFYSRPCGRGDDLRAGQAALLHVDFYSRPCGRGDSSASVTAFAAESISTHAPAGGATTMPASSCARVKFLLTPLREGRREWTGDPLHRRYFYSRPCGRGDQESCPAWRRSPHFYSRPCGRGDQALACHIGRGCNISTHAPAGGATCRNAYRQMQNEISTHAPAGGATSRSRRPPLRRRPISTHAPAGGATL